MEKILANALGEDVSKLATVEKQRLLARLLARFSHEIRNPLSSLDIHVQLLAEDLGRWAPQLAEKTAGRFEVIQGELRRLEGVVKQFLRLAGPSALDLEPLELDKIIGHVCDLLRPEAASRGIDLVMDAVPGLPMVKADACQLTQAIVNLVINAIQATEPGGRIVVTERRDDTRAGVRVEVHDTGPGVPPEKLAAIFEPFYTTKAGGSGLGLWIAQQIAMAHGGTIQAANHPSGGAIFTLSLPG